MNIQKNISLGLLVILCSGCSTHDRLKQPDVEQNNYKIFSLEDGSTALMINEDKKVMNIGLQTNGLGTSFNMRERKNKDIYEMVCISRKQVDSDQLNLITCLKEQSADKSSSQAESIAYRKEDIVENIEKIQLEKGVKLNSFVFSLDDDKDTEYTTRKRELSETPESYTVIRLLSDKSVWSGKEMLMIEER
jgi:hypothetical protein